MRCARARPDRRDAGGPPPLSSGLARGNREGEGARTHRDTGRLRRAVELWALSSLTPAPFDDATSRVQVNRFHLFFRMPIFLPHGFVRRDRCRRHWTPCRRRQRRRAGQVLISWVAYTTDRRIRGELAHRSEYRRWRCPIRDSNLRLSSPSWSSRADYCARRGPLVIVD